MVGSDTQCAAKRPPAVCHGCVVVFLYMQLQHLKVHEAHPQHRGGAVDPTQN